MSEPSLSDTPVQVAIESLQRQVQQLQKILKTGELEPTNSNEQELRDEIKQLRTANAKAEYRIKMLLKALEEKDKQIEK